MQRDARAGVRHPREPTRARGGPRRRDGPRGERLVAGGQPARPSAPGRPRPSPACASLEDATWIRGNTERWLTDRSDLPADTAVHARRAGLRHGSRRRARRRAGHAARAGAGPSAVPRSPSTPRPSRTCARSRRRPRPRRRGADGRTSARNGSCSATPTSPFRAARGRGRTTSTRGPSGCPSTATTVPPTRCLDPADGVRHHRVSPTTTPRGPRSSSRRFGGEPWVGVVESRLLQARFDVGR